MDPPNSQRARRVVTIVVVVAAAVGVSVLNAPPASAKAVYTCKGGQLTKMWYEETFFADGTKGPAAARYESLGGCAGGDWSFVAEVAGPPDTDDTPGVGKADLAAAPAAEERPTLATCAKPTVRGTPGHDVIVLHNSADNIVDAGDGNDVIVSLGTGNDVLCGGLGDDVLFGGSGSDSLFGGDGSNVLVGGPNDGAQDYLDGGTGRGTCTRGDEPPDLIFPSEGCGTAGDIAAKEDAARGQQTSTTVRRTTTTARVSRATTTRRVGTTTPTTSAVSTTAPAVTTTTAESTTSSTAAS